MISQNTLRIPFYLLIFINVLGFIFACTIAWNRAFQVDEVEHLHVMYNMRQGLLLYVDFWQGHNPLLYYLMLPLVNVDDPVATFHRARLVSLFFMSVNLGCVAFIASRLTRHLDWRIVAGLATAFLLTQSTWVERGIEVRPDVPMSTCLSIALALQYTQIERLRRYCLQGLVLSAAFLFTQKAAIGCFAFGCLWLFSAVYFRQIRLVIIPMLTWILPYLLVLSGMYLAGNLEAYFTINVIDQMKVVGGKAPWRMSFSPVSFFEKEGYRNILFYLIAPAGILLALSQVRKSSAHFFAGFVGVILLVSLYINPFPFPYLHVTVLPTMAILMTIFVDKTGGLLETRSGRNGTWFVAFLPILCGATSLPRIIEMTPSTTTYQFDMLREIQRITLSTDRVFDMVGLYFRPDGNPVFFMTENVLSRYRYQRFKPIPSVLRDLEVLFLMANYRFFWLNDDEKKFIGEHYIHFDGNIYLHGVQISNLPAGATRNFDVLQAREFEYTGDGRIQIDGHTFGGGVLTRGVHRITLETLVIKGRLTIKIPSPPAENRWPEQLIYRNFD